MIISSSAGASTPTARIVGCLFHLLAKRATPAVISFPVEDIPHDLIPEDGLAQLVDVLFPVLFGKIIRPIYPIDIFQEILESVNQRRIRRSCQELEWPDGIGPEWYG